MKIETIKIQNFKCLGPQEIKIDLSEDIAVLIGENNVGKSSVLEILKYFFSGTKTIPKELFCDGKTDSSHAIQVVVEFSNLTKEDKTHQAIRSRIKKIKKNDRWVLIKKYYYKEDKCECDYFTLTDSGLKKNPGGFKTICDDLFTNDKMQIAFIEAVKSVEEESSSSGKSAFAQVFNMLVRGEVQSHKKFEDLERAIKEYSSLFEAGNKLPAVEDLEKVLNKSLQRIIKVVNKINLKVPPFKDKIMPEPILLTNDGREIDVDPKNQGHGLQRVLIFSLLEILAERISPSDKKIGPKNLLMIEEPEIYMHPQMERKIADTLYEIASDGATQVICTTHSPVFINVADKHKALVRFTRDENNRLKLTQVEEIFSEPNRKDKKNRLRMILNFDPAINEVFFAKRVVLVEGDTEIAVLKEAAELLKIFQKPDAYHLRRDVTFVNCRGKWTITAFQEVLNHFGIDYVVIHDKDEEDLEEGANERILNLLENDKSRRKVFHKKIEDQLGISDSSKDKPFRALEAVRKLNKSELDKKLGGFIRFAYEVN